MVSLLMEALRLTLMATHRQTQSTLIHTMETLTICNHNSRYEHFSYLMSRQLQDFFFHILCSIRCSIATNCCTTTSSSSSIQFDCISSSTISKCPLLWSIHGRRWRSKYYWYVKVFKIDFLEEELYLGEDSRIIDFLEN